MDLGKLGKRARNELLRNPKKSAILGVICLVALYFWLPLLRGWLPGGKSKKPTKVVAKVDAAPVGAATTEATASETKANARAEAAFRWDKLERLRKQDPLMTSAQLATAVRNPFQGSDDARREIAAREEVESKPAPPVAAEKPIVEWTPAGLGLVLKGTMCGARVKVATINDQAYREGAVVRIRSAASSPAATNESEGIQPEAEAEAALEFKLTKVRPNAVVLTRDGKSYTLEFRRERPLAGNEIVLGRPSVVAEPVSVDSE